MTLLQAYRSQRNFARQGSASKFYIFTPMNKMGKKMKKVLQRYLIFRPLVIAAICSIQPLISNAAINPSPATYRGLQNTEITLDYPDQIKAGTDFSFSVNIKDQKPLLSAGNLTVQFSEGFLPHFNEINGIAFQATRNTANLRWEQLTDGNLYQFTFEVETAELEKGVYPVRVAYESNNGVVKANAGLYVMGKVKTPEDFAKVQEKPSPISIRLNYPEEVLLNDSYPLIIEIAKGKNTGGAGIEIRIPPASSISLEENTDYTYQANSGKLAIRLQSMPPNPVFTLEVQVQNANARKAVYPISASVVFDNKTSATFSDYIFLTDQLSGAIHSATKPKANAEADEDLTRIESTFSELDKLLEAWTASTIGNGSGNANNKPSKPATTDIKPDEVQKAEPKEPGKSQPAAATPTNENPVATFFTVQVAASQVKMPKLKNFMRSLQITETVKEDYDGELYRYIVGEYGKIEQAKAMRLTLINKGFSDAFVVKYEGGKRVTP